MKKSSISILCYLISLTAVVCQEMQLVWDTYGMGVSDAKADAENPSSPYYATYATGTREIFRVIKRD